MTIRDERTGRFVSTVLTGPHWTELFAGLGVNAFCRRTGLQAEALTRWARGSRPRNGSAAQIAVATGRDVAEVWRILDAIAADAAREQPEAARAFDVDAYDVAGDA